MNAKSLCQGVETQERRKGFSCPIGDDVELLRDQLTAIQQPITAYLVEQKTALEGFPLNAAGNPDVEGHKSYHEALIIQAKARTEFWHKLTFELAKYGLLGFAVWASRELWIAFLHGPKG
jgi:hypothetical protein